MHGNERVRKITTCIHYILCALSLSLLDQESSSIVLEYLPNGDLKHFLTVSDVIQGALYGVRALGIKCFFPLTGKSTSYKTAGEVHD